MRSSTSKLPNVKATIMASKTVTVSPPFGVKRVFLPSLPRSKPLEREKIRTAYRNVLIWIIMSKALQVKFFKLGWEIFGSLDISEYYPVNLGHK